MVTRLDPPHTVIALKLHVHEIDNAAHTPKAEDSVGVLPIACKIDQWMMPATEFPLAPFLEFKVALRLFLLLRW